MKHYVLDDNIRNLLMQTILKEEQKKKPERKLSPQGAEYAAGLAARAKEAGEDIDVEAYKKERAKKEAEGDAAQGESNKPPDDEDRGQRTTNPDIIKARQAELAKRARAGAAAARIGVPDLTNVRRGMVTNPHTNPQARKKMQDTAEKFAAIERAARARDAARATRRNR